jgi:hypothetical protein
VAEVARFLEERALAIGREKFEANKHAGEDAGEVGEARGARGDALGRSGVVRADTLLDEATHDLAAEAVARGVGRVEEVDVDPLAAPGV